MAGQKSRTIRDSFIESRRFNSFSRKVLVSRSIWKPRNTDNDETEEVRELSDIGKIIGKQLSLKNFFMHGKSWNVTSGYIVGKLHQTPMNGWNLTTDPEEGHDFWFPEKVGEIISRTKVFCDIMTLGVPTGNFMEEIQKALALMAENISDPTRPPIIVRFLVAKIPGFALNLRQVLNTVTKLLPADAKVQIWMGAWRRGPSWNHAKIIAVDGTYLWTGGHNFWDEHYLRSNPVADLSLELRGEVSHDGHYYANEQWKFIKRKHSSCFQSCIDNCYPKFLPLPTQTRISIKRWPNNSAAPYPPSYDRMKYEKLARPNHQNLERPIRIITFGRYGKMNDAYGLVKRRSSDDALIAMFNAATSTIRLAIQDLGPVCIPKTKVKIPGSTWPKKYLQAFANAICDRNVTVEICLSNPHSIPGGLSPFQAQYGNGWNCEDVIIQIAKKIEKNQRFKFQMKKKKKERVRQLINNNLKVCFVSNQNGNKWKDGKTIGMHAKHFIIDSKCCYIGSQNLYDCDLGEWGIFIDDINKTHDIMNQYWIPMWDSSYVPLDTNTARMTLELDRIKEGKTIDTRSHRDSPSDMYKLHQSLRYGTVNMDLNMIKEGSESDTESNDGDEKEEGFVEHT